VPAGVAGKPRTAAQLTAAEKNAVSHRGQALRALLAGLAPPKRIFPGMKRGRLFVIAAPSGAGKTSLVKALLAHAPQLRVSISHTTRRQRPTEEGGREYYFVTVPEFEALIARGELLEHACVFGNFYGTSRAFVDRQLGAGHDVVLEIDWQGAQQVRARMPECTSIFILPPSRAALAERLVRRATDNEDVIARRLADSVADMSHYREFGYVVVNDDFDQAVADLRSIVAGQGEDLRSDRPGLKALLAELLAAP